MTGSQLAAKFWISCASEACSTACTGTVVTIGAWCATVPTAAWAAPACDAAAPWAFGAAAGA